MKHTVYLYSIARYLIVAVEARYNKATTQSWKEIRDAFDHYARSLIQEKDDRTDHVKKIEGHIQRSILDTCKILCRDVHDEYQQILRRYDEASIIFIDNGDFVQNLKAKSIQAEEMLHCAKTQDIDLGDNEEDNKKVLNKYLEAYFMYESILIYVRDKSDVIHPTNKVFQYFKRIKNKISPLGVIKSVVWLVIGTPVIWLLSKVTEIFYQEYLEAILKNIVKVTLSFLKTMW